MLVFVYGSLKRGFSNHHFLRGQTFLGPARTEPRYRMFDYGGFPAAVEVTTDGIALEGELYEVDEPGLRLLDWLEDIEGGLYRRGSAHVTTGPGTVHEALIYLYLKEISGLPEAGPAWPKSLDLGAPSEIPNP